MTTPCFLSIPPGGSGTAFQHLASGPAVFGVLVNGYVVQDGIGAATFDKAASLGVSYPPAANSGTTINTPLSVWVQSGASRFDGPVVANNGFANWQQLTQETISGVRAVAVSQSGWLLTAMAAVSGRMPAVGVVFDNVASGVLATVYTDGAGQQPTSGLSDYSGYLGAKLYVGRSGQLTTCSGSWSSGGFASGDQGQVVGVARNSGAALLRVSFNSWSGGPLGPGPF